ncbi:hypothetical protein KHC28_03415 [Ancylobacter sonchi]|uniref:hypothetical protein n=1 Tax=Ancylobacter sonchi TaxID=1937790 RepID=UPI001BD5D165|nr:hypothetical protein [Ancylobacter sonchi]MBS7532700.1 hypothetical protein [Ancylobacter sonchi]
MTDPQQLRTLLGERLEIVQEIARLNARQLQNRQVFSGLELEVMRCERDVSRSGDMAAVADRLEQARAQRDRAEARLVEDDHELLEWQRRLDVVDRRISRS